jgi:hypothetical protein
VTNSTTDMPLSVETDPLKQHCIMVDVKLDIGDYPSLKMAFHKKKSGPSIVNVLMYLMLIAAVLVLAFDAAEFVKIFLGLKILKAEEFIKMTAAYETQLAQKIHLFNVISSERDDLLNQVKGLMDECNAMSQAGHDKENHINNLTGERDAVI